MLHSLTCEQTKIADRRVDNPTHRKCSVSSPFHPTFMIPEDLYLTRLQLNNNIFYLFSRLIEPADSTISSQKLFSATILQQQVPTRDELYHLIRRCSGKTSQSEISNVINIPEELDDGRIPTSSTLLTQ